MEMFSKCLTNIDTAWTHSRVIITVIPCNQTHLIYLRILTFIVMVTVSIQTFNLMSFFLERSESLKDRREEKRREEKRREEKRKITFMNMWNNVWVYKRSINMTERKAFSSVSHTNTYKHAAVDSGDRAGYPLITAMAVLLLST